MRKKLMLLLPFLAGVFFFACPQYNWYRDPDGKLETVIRVELIYYFNPDAKIIKRNSEKYFLLPFDFDKMEIIATLPEERNDAFLKEFKSKTLYYVREHPDSPQGLCIRLISENGNFMLVSRDGGSDRFPGYSAWFDSHGNVTEMIGDGLDYVFNGLINRHFEIRW
jgi:hypothetical protein